MFKTVLDEQLSNVTVPVNATCCCNLKCKSEQCRTEAVNYCESIFHVIEYAATITMSTKPVKKHKNKNKNKSKPVPGWSEHLLGLKDSAIFWRSVWKSSG